MEYIERLSKLADIEKLLANFIEENSKNEDIELKYFTGNFFDDEIHGIFFRCERKNFDFFESLLGFVDIPAMINGFQVDVTDNSLSSSILYGFVFDDDNFHPLNVKKINVYPVSREIVLKYLSSN